VTTQQDTFENRFKVLTTFEPVRWQARLYTEYFAKGELPTVVNIPTGLGKTAMMALWLIARHRCAVTTAAYLCGRAPCGHRSGNRFRGSVARQARFAGRDLREVRRAAATDDIAIKAIKTVERTAQALQITAAGRQREEYGDY
jgi:hypothetical protein